MTTRRLALTATALMPLIWLSGCGYGGAAIDDYYQPQMHYERFPIEVAKGTVRLDVTTKRTTLTDRQEDAVAKFAQQALDSGAQHINIRRPSGSRAEAVADQVTELLVARGIAPEAIVHKDNAGGKGGAVVLTFERKFAVTAECGDWSDDLAITGHNQPPPDFGCATQHNMAAVVANPEDFQTPRASTPADPMRRNQVFVDYRKPKSTATPGTESEVQTVSDIAK
jgi:pilus assembly protein CpaD